MDIQTQKSYLFLHDRLLSACGSESCFFPESQPNPWPAHWTGHSILTKKGVQIPTANSGNARNRPSCACCLQPVARPHRSTVSARQCISAGGSAPCLCLQRWCASQRAVTLSSKRGFEQICSSQITKVCDTFGVDMDTGTEAAPQTRAAVSVKK